MISNFYIRTAHSWYLLEEPSESYRREYREFWLPHRLSQVITEFALRAPDADFQELSGHLKQLSPEARWMVGRKGTGVDLEDVEQWVGSFRLVFIFLVHDVIDPHHSARSQLLEATTLISSPVCNSACACHIQPSGTDTFWACSVVIRISECRVSTSS